MSLHYLGKRNNQKFAILMHIKHVSNVTFYYLSNRCLPNIMKITAKINTMQNTNILLFCSFTVLKILKDWRNASLRYGPISDKLLLTLQLTSEGKVSRHVSVQMVDTLNTFCEQTLANNLHFSCVFGSSVFCPSCLRFCCVDAWWSIGLPCLTAKL